MNSQQDPVEDTTSLAARLEDLQFLLKRKYRLFIDKVAIYPTERWIGFLVLASLYAVRIYFKEGYSVITYLLGLFFLNQVMLYLAPLEDPDDLEFGGEDGESILPMREQDEYKGFQRKLQELELWKLLMQGVLLCMFLTLFDFFAFPMHWPLLVFYFLMMTTFLCRYKIEHMIRYRYIPFDFGKKSYGKRKFGGK
ncbi:hypothetical protein FGO68_gene12562 [Halteria grandinella]|uniref:Protein RER1 n=1 Tax=Halteria grandinella TaxID=5974 RepID=A0A8J8SYR8_HALGN|nr:hypothetical protein FGO68_gene12562 [Halteria grandinella]